MNINLSEANYTEVLGVLIGTYCAVLGNGFYRKYQRLLKHGLRVNGEVIEVVGNTRWGINDRFATTYYPIIRYETNDGPVVMKYDFVKSNPSIYKQWETVAVIYDPKDHKNFVLENTSSGISGPLLMLIGFGAIITAVIFYILDPARIIRF